MSLNIHKFFGLNPIEVDFWGGGGGGELPLSLISIGTCILCLKCDNCRPVKIGEKIILIIIIIIIIIIDGSSSSSSSSSSHSSFNVLVEDILNINNKYLL